MADTTSPARTAPPGGRPGDDVGDGPMISLPGECAVVGANFDVKGTYAGAGPISVTVIATAWSPCDGGGTFAPPAGTGQAYSLSELGGAKPLGSGSSAVDQYGNWAVNLSIAVPVLQPAVITASAAGGGSATQNIKIQPS